MLDDESLLTSVLASGDVYVINPAATGMTRTFCQSKQL